MTTGDGPTSGSTPAGSIPPGWYDDAQGVRRWWDGLAWTEHVDPAYGRPAAGAPQQPFGQPAATQPGYGFAQPGQAQPASALPWPPTEYLHGAGSDFAGAFTNAFKHGFVYRGRASRSSFWWFALANALMVIAAYLVVIVAAVAVGGTDSAALDAVGVVLWIAAFAGYVYLWLVGLSLSVRRLHDRDMSGWWYLIGLVPFGGIVLLVFFLLEGTPGPNRYDAAV